MKKTSVIRTIITYVLLILVAIYAIGMLSSDINKKMTYTELMQKIEEDKVSSIVLDNTRDSAKVKIKDEENVTREVKIPDTSAFITKIQDDVTSGNLNYLLQKKLLWKC